jgi:4-hydroxy-tetrahydrodipicolinate reductase
MKPKLVVIGAAGRMGKRILSLAIESGDFDIIGAVERQDHPDIGKEASVLTFAEPINVELAHIYPYPTDVDVAIDFSIPVAAVRTVDYCLEKDIALVLGTTGLNDEQHEKIKTASRKIPILYAPNMSVAMNVLFNLIGKVSEMLGEEYDIEIVEQHHRFKKDAPSGTALKLAEKIQSATGREWQGSLTYGRSDGDALSHKGKIGIHAIRAGDITGIHSIIFSTLGETLTLTHTAHSRDTFARGALLGAKWLVEKNPGLYSMADVLGIT